MQTGGRSSDCSVEVFRLYAVLPRASLAGDAHTRVGMSESANRNTPLKILAEVPSFLLRNRNFELPE
jgi:hypothetical protein